MSAKHKITILSILVVLAMITSCSHVRLDNKEYIESAFSSIEDELTENSISVERTNIEFKLTGGEGRAILKICIEDCSEEEAERIFDEIIFPYMSTDNSVVANLMMPGGTLPEYYILITNADTEHVTIYANYHTNVSRQRCEIWESEDRVIRLEDYR